MLHVVHVGQKQEKCQLDHCKDESLGLRTETGINGLLHPCSSWFTCTNQGVPAGDPEISTVERSPKLPTFPPPTGRDHPGHHQIEFICKIQDAASYIFVSITQVRLKRNIKSGRNCLWILT